MNIATGAIGGIISKLAELVKSEYMQQTGVKGQVESLTMELKSAQAFLQEIDKVHPDQLNKQVKIWADEVREASYDMDDVLDTFLVRVMGPKPTEKNMLEWLWEKMSSLFIKAKACHDIANTIGKVNRKVKEIDERRRRYKLDDHVASPTTPSSSIDPRIAVVYRTKASLLIGIEEPKDAVIKMLAHSEDMYSKKTKVVTLVGFGGVGKTTLAKATYDQLQQQYESVAFVSVGQKPDLVKVFKDILFYLDKQKLERINSTRVGADVLIPELLDFLRDKRYLIVVDDVWETQSRKRILEALIENDFGSRIIITTRNSEVAIGEVYEVKPLSGDNSKRLFYTRIFGGEDQCLENQCQKVSEVEDKILKKCGGVPLAIITMASYLVGKSMEEWLAVCNSTGFCGKDKEQTGDTEWILSLSYYDLPSHLKTCLLYLSIFPEDYLIRKDPLIWMWIAEGFIVGRQGTGLFEIGEGYFNELINKNLIQLVEERNSMVVKGCRVHDMILDLIRSLAREASFATVFDNSEEIFTASNAHRLVLQKGVVEDTTDDNGMDTTRARSFIAFRCDFVPQIQLRSFKLLRILHLEECYNVHFAKHIGNLHHLRCLGIRCNYDICNLPKELGALKFLQVLCLEGVNRGDFLPQSVEMLTRLVCLRAPWMNLSDGMIKNLTSLQELQINDPSQVVKDLFNLTELRVLVVNSGIMDERMRSDFLMSVGNLHKLQRLDLACRCSVTGNHGLPSFINPSHPPKLSHLSLKLHSLSDEGLQILGGLPELSYLCLSTTGGATLTGTTARRYFQKLRSCLLPDSMVQFVVNEEDSSVSFTIWHQSIDAPRFGSKRKQEKCRVPRAIMPNLESLFFQVSVKKLTACNNGSCDNIGLEYLAFLQKVTVRYEYSSYAGRDARMQEKEALRHTIQVHPNRPKLQLIDW